MGEQINKKYEPTKQEVFREMAKIAAEGTMYFLGGLLISSVLFGTIPYYLPTSTRKMNEPSVPASTVSSPNPKSLDVSIAIGSVVALGSWVGQIAGYKYLYDNGYGKLCFLPLVTNVASGLYEIGRHMYNVTREELIKRYEAETSGLETKIESCKNVC